MALCSRDQNVSKKFKMVATKTQRLKLFMNSIIKKKLVLRHV
jgi:hypothetical protein